MKKFNGLLSLMLAGTMLTFPSVPAFAEETSFVPKAVYEFQDPSAPAGERIDNLLSMMTLEEKIALSSGNGAINRLAVNGMRSGSGEGLHGVDDKKVATVFPSSIALSQTWDKDLMYKIGEAIAEESLADNGAPARLVPVLDLLRDPRFGRSYETYGEDAYLTGMLGTAITGGLNKRTEQGYQQFIPILKHPLAYNTEINRLWTNSVMTPRTENEYFIRAFKYPISAGNAKSLMNSYPIVTGKPMSVNPLQHDLLFNWTPDYPETGHYEYKTTNDYGSGSSMFVHSQRYFDDDPLGRAFGVAQGTKNGQMGWSFRSYGSNNGGSQGGATGPLYDAYARGLLTEKDFEENARRALTMTLRMGDLDQMGIQSPYLVPGAQTSASRPEVVKGNRDLAFQASQEQIVLLKNDGVLPLKGDATSGVVLLGPLADQINNDHYTGARLYSVTIKDALENKLGKENVSFNRAIDTIAIKASNGKYLVNAENPIWRQAGWSKAEDTPILASGENSQVSMEDKPLLFELYDYGSTYNLLRTPINNQYVQVTPFKTDDNNTYPVTAINNTSSPGEANKLTGETSYVNYQTFRVVPTTDGKWGFYNLIAGNGSNGGVGKAYDADDEDINNGSYLMLDAQGRLVADLSTIGPYRNENHVDGPSIVESKADKDGSDAAVDSLKDESKFEIQTVQSSEAAIDAAIANAKDATSPVILVLGYEPHLNSREAFDLYKTGLSDQQMRIINHVTNDLNRDVILIVKTGNAMTINEAVVSNAKVKAIVEIGQTGQEEGSALVSALFDDGYKVPKAGFEPALPDHNTGDKPEAFAEYPGYLADAENGTVPAYSPAGRLTATWYKQITDMIGASEDHPPASYAWPNYNEETNDNLSNMNGTINTGIMTYDIIKGERTYQYFNGTPLYAFGYGLTYTNFEYSGFAVSPVKDGKFTVSGSVTNKGTAASDEVVQIYSSFSGTPSRIKQANNRLVAFDRLKDIKAGETRTFSFEVDMLDTMGVWDVEDSKMIVEAGEYTIKAAASSDTPAAAGNSGALTVDANNGGSQAAVRTLSDVTLAQNFDDYSNVGGRVDDIELVSSSIAYASDTAVKFRKNNAWLVFKDVNFAQAPTKLTALVGSDREGTLNIYALEPGTDPSALNSAAPIATISLTDTRPIQGLATGLGIGPVGVNPGTPEGQAYKDAYVKPAFAKASADVTLAAGSYDLYIMTANRGSEVDWIKFGTALDTTQSIAISQLDLMDSIRVKGAALKLTADLTPVTSMDEVAWSVTDPSGAATDIAAIDEKGVLTAAGAANGKVLVTATANGQTATKEILITNQLDSNKVVVEGNPKTAEYILITTGGKFGQNDNIMRYKGTNQQTVIFGEQFSENPENYYLPGTYLTVTPDQITWKVTDLDGNDTKLAAIDAQGLLTATGSGDGKVKVSAVLNSNPDIFSERVITLQNQTPKNAFALIQAEHFDVQSADPAPASVSAFGAKGNEIGLSLDLAISKDIPAMTLQYDQIDFGKGAGKIYLRMAADTQDVSVKISIDGQPVQTLEKVGTGSIVNYEAIAADIGHVEGIHDLTLEFSGAPCRLNWFQFE